MLYAILCYNDESAFVSGNRDEETAVMGRIAAIRKKLVAEGRLEASARLLPTTSAITLRKDREPPLVLDGPFAETKEQLLGFYMVECASLDVALETARELAGVSPGGSFEIRPVALYEGRPSSSV